MSLEINLARWQSDFLLHPSRFKVAVCGRRSGKSTSDAVAVYLSALSLENANIWYVAETHQQAKDLMWDWLVEGGDIGGKRMKPLFPPEIIAEKSTKLGDMYIKLHNGTKISLKGSQNVDALLGSKLDLLVLDEYQSQKADVWFKLQPMLADNPNSRCIVTGTPRGFGNHLYTLWSYGQKSNPAYDSNWHSVLVTTLQAGFIHPDEIERAKKMMSPKQFKQEYEANFANSEQLVYPDFDPVKNGTLKTVNDFHHSFPISLGMDFNRGIMATTVSIVDNDDNVWVVDEFYGEENIQTLIAAVRKRYPFKTIHAYPDSNAKTTGISEVAIMEAAGWIVYRNKQNPTSPNYSNPRVVDRINSVNAKICNALGERSLYVNIERCPHLVKSLSQQGYVGNDPDKSSNLDHCLVAGTMVTMADGSLKDIIDVEVGDFVMTRNGPCRVSFSGQTGADRIVYTLTTVDGHTVTGTDNHRILVDGKWTELGTLHKYLNAPKEKLCKSKSTTVSNSAGSLNLQTMQTNCISSQPNLTNYTEKQSFTDLCGEMYTVKFHPDTTSTTKTEILPTTPSTIWNASAPQTTEHITLSTVQKSSYNEVERTVTEFVPSPKSGMEVKKDVSGTVNMVSKPGQNANQSTNTLALSVANTTSSLSSLKEMLPSAPAFVCQPTVDSQELTMCSGRALSVEIYSTQTSTSPTSTVSRAILSVAVDPNPAEAVYDLTVEGEHEFIANGIVVHNCVDAIGYHIYKLFPIVQESHPGVVVVSG